ncbi:MAG TPA: DUF6603 domain-containing protein, partial [Pyrinomonadaceae bacterium]
MPEPKGTLQSFALALAEILSALERELAPGEARFLMRELGIGLSNQAESLIAGPLQATVSNVSEVVALAQQLIGVLESDDQSQILSITPNLIEKIGTTIDSFGTLANAIRALNLSEVPAVRIDDLPKNLLNYMLVRRFSLVRGLNELLQFLNILEEVIENPDSTDPNNPPFSKLVFNFKNLSKWVKSPRQQLAALYDWDDDSFDAAALFIKLEPLFLALGAPPFFDEEVTPPKLDLVVAELTPNTDLTPPGLEIRSKIGLDAGEFSFALDDEMKLVLTLGFDTSFGSGLIIQPNGNVTLISPATDVTISAKVELRFEADRTALPNKYILIGEVGGNRLEIGKLVARAGVEIVTGSAGAEEADAVGKFFIAGELGQGRLVLDLSKSDGFLSSLLPGTNIDSAFEVAFGYDSEQGLFFRGSSTLAIQIPTHFSLGPIEISAISIATRIEGASFPLFATANMNTTLGPLEAVVTDIGLRTDVELRSEHDGNFGPVDVSIGFKPPRGIGLSIDGGGFKGGGFIDFEPEQERYSGMLELEFQDQFTLKAFALLNTRLPNGQSGFSLLIIISAEFTPIQLGLGFKLTGVGGLLGLNRTINIDPLRTGLRDNTLSSILFPTDVVANADRIISDLRQVFPPANGRFIFGPMAKIAWGT